MLLYRSWFKVAKRMGWEICVFIWFKTQPWYKQGLDITILSIKAP